MTPEQIRLECLKLAHRHDREPAQVVARAEEYERYVSSPLPAPEPPRRGRPRKAGNPFD